MKGEHSSTQEVLSIKDFQDSAFFYFARISVRSQKIYLMVILFALSCLLSLPFVYVDISIQSLGIIRPLNEKVEVKAVRSGVIKDIFVKENKSVKKGQLLFSIGPHGLLDRLELNLKLQKQELLFVEDLSKMVKYSFSSKRKMPVLHSSLFRQAFVLVHFQLEENLKKQDKVRKELEADTKLYTEKAIAKRDYDAKLYEYNAILAEFSSKVEQQLAQWEMELTQHQQKLLELKAEEIQLRNDKEFCNIFSPLSGTIHQIEKISRGVFLQSGEVAGVVSPDSILLVECYIPPKDIGLIAMKQKATFLIDAFNYNDWGVISGEVTDISNDFILINDRPVFKIKCRVDKNLLQLRNGYTGYLKKGMTTQARFVVAKRSLFQLLYDNVNDWVNPKVSNR